LGLSTNVAKTQPCKTDFPVRLTVLADGLEVDFLVRSFTNTVRPVVCGELATK
jgi:hypothetical protein